MSDNLPKTLARYEKEMRYHWGYSGGIVKLIKLAERYEDMPLAKKVASFALALTVLGTVEVADRINGPNGCSGGQGYKVYAEEPFDRVVKNVATNITLETGSPTSLASIREFIMQQNDRSLWVTVTENTDTQLVMGDTNVIRVPERCS